MDKRLYQSIIALAAAVLALAACRKETVATEGVEDENAIAFSCAPTKALVESITPLRDNGIAVYGFATDSKSITTAVFDKTPLAYSSSTGKWNYTPLEASRYWVPNNFYDFVGLYPRSIESTYSGNVVSFSHTITGYTYLQQVDLLAGYASRNFVNTGSGFDKSTVTLPMGHVLSSLVIKVRNASSESTVSLSNISITGLYTAGDCQIAPKADGSDCTVTWTPTGDRLTDTDFYGGDILLKNIATGVDALDMFQEKLLIIPQAVNSDDIALNFTVTTGSGSANKIIKFNATEVLTWQPGKKYTYTANITDNYITFKLTVNDWVEDDAIEL